MKIKVGKRYLTRNGQLAFVFFEGKDSFCFVISGDGLLYFCRKDGKMGFLNHDHLDLVAPYKPKRREPKVGDMVEFEFHDNDFYERGEIKKIEDGTYPLLIVKSPHASMAYRVTRRQIVNFLNKESGK